MDNNTAPNDGLTYPDFAQNTANSGSVSQATTTPLADDTNTLEGLATQLANLQQETMTPAPTVTNPSDIGTVVPDSTPVQENVVQNLTNTSVTDVSPTPPEPQFDLPQQAVPVPTNIMTETSIGVVRNTLDDIMPGEKLPRAIQRTPKENNLSKPVTPAVVKEHEARSKVVKSDSTFDDIASNGHNTVVDTPRPNNIDDLLKYAISHNASDLHISVGYPAIVRIDGTLKEIDEKIISPQDAEELIMPMLSDEKKELLEVNKEIDFAYFYEDEQTARFRVNAYYTMKNLAAAFRLIPSRVRTIEELLLPQLYHQFAQLKQGLILITGPTGHGKSTTLASILEDVNRTRFCHIITIEDPIEYVFEGKRALIDQREMNEDTHSWPIALRSALRQDPDVILVGEMRDYETIAAAITLAETGHLVFATLHTNNASQTIDRIIDVFPENQQPQIRSQLSNILEAVVAQRLIPLDKGGRRAVSEILIANPAIRNIIREGKTHQIDNVIRTSSDVGMVSLERALVNLVREGVITVQRAQEYSIYPEEVLRLLKS